MDLSALRRTVAAHHPGRWGLARSVRLAERCVGDGKAGGEIEADGMAHLEGGREIHRADLVRDRTSAFPVPLRLIRAAEHQGPGYARNVGVARARRMPSETRSNSNASTTSASSGIRGVSAERIMSPQSPRIMRRLIRPEMLSISITTSTISTM